MSHSLDINVLGALEPLSTFSPARLKELLEYCQLEKIEKNRNPFENQGLKGQSVYLIKGEIELWYADGNEVVMRADSEWSRHPIGKRQPDIQFALAVTPVQLLRINDELLDQMVTWDQFAYEENDTATSTADGSQSLEKRMLNSGLFSAENLKKGPFAHLPAANISELLNRIEVVAVWENEVIIEEGQEGDFYYVIESGRAEVTRKVGGVQMLLSEIKAQDVFGEEALIANSKRNATVTMKSNGVLLRINKHDFTELMQKPLLHTVTYAEAQRKIAAGALWLDVRYPPEFRHDKLEGAINVPLNDIRDAVGVLDMTTHYIVYCQSGRRSAAAAFILARAGYQVDVLQDGLWSIPKASV